MEIVKLHWIGTSLLEIKVGHGFGSEINLGTFRRDECLDVAQHLREVANELEEIDDWREFISNLTRTADD